MSFQLPEPYWPVAWLKEQDLYFVEPEITSYAGSDVDVAAEGSMVMFGSYSYLGLMQHPEINRAAKAAVDQWGTGAHGARLVAGTTTEHRELERDIARFTGKDDAIVFSSGYACNVGTISGLVGRGDVVIGDKLNHASIVDGCVLSGAEFVRFAHNDMAHLDDRLRACADRKNKLVVVDSVFSMDGDIIDLPSVVAICRKRDALLMVDEAHSLGVLGATGRGIEEHFGLPSDAVDLKMGTLSKTIPSMGGYIAASGKIIETLKNRSRAFIFSASLAPPLVAAARAALRIMQLEPWRLDRLRENCERFTRQLTSHGLDTGGSRTPIVPIMIRDSELVWRAARACQRRGLFVQAIPSPVVRKGDERIRCIVTADHTTEQLDMAAQVIADVVGTVVPAAVGMSRLRS